MDIVCFDWDDTLLPSTHLNLLGYSIKADHPRILKVDEHLKVVEERTHDLLSTALARSAQVMIITNSEHGWVTMSAEKFIPGVLPLLKRCTIVSARSLYEPLYPDDPLKWKLTAFGKITAVHVISFGDSQFERTALFALKKDGLLTKSIKFVEKPSIEQLSNQIKFVNNVFDYIFTHKDELDLMLTITMDN